MQNELTTKPGARTQKKFQLIRASRAGEFKLGIKTGETREAIFTEMARKSPLNIIVKEGRQTFAETIKGGAHFYLDEII